MPAKIMRDHLGELYIFIFSFFIALSTVITHILTRQLNPLLIAFYSFTFAFIVLFFIRLKANKSLTFQIIKHWKLVLLVNFSTAIDWILIFIALKYVSGSLVNCFVFGIAPIATLLLSIKSYSARRELMLDLSFSLIICFILILLSILYYKNINLPLQRVDLLFSISLCCLSGFATGVTALACKKLHSSKFDTLSIMKIRFIALIILSFIFLLSLNIQIAITLKDCGILFLLTLMFIILPSFFLQKGIERTSAISVVITSSSIPVLTYVFQLCDPSYHLNFLELLLILLLSLAICVSTFYRRA